MGPASDLLEVKEARMVAKTRTVPTCRMAENCSRKVGRTALLHGPRRGACFPFTLIDYAAMF